jgi:hypothetical protein
MVADLSAWLLGTDRRSCDRLGGAIAGAAFRLDRQSRTLGRAVDRDDSVRSSLNRQSYPIRIATDTR